MRRLPVYLLIDVSYSMEGEPIHAVQQGVNNLIKELRKNPYALETAYLSVITFGSEAQVMNPLTELMDFAPKEFVANGLTSLGAGLDLVGERIKQEVVKNTPEKRGDWKPLVFIMTDGIPTDDWGTGLASFKELDLGVVVACAAGEQASIDLLKMITPNIVELDTPDEDSIKGFFEWISKSIQVSSTKVESAGNDISGIGELPPPPKGINLVKK